MTVKVLATDHGPHPADKWAEATASMLVEIADHLSGERRAAAVKLQAAVIDILEGHHRTAQDGERAKLAEHGLDRLAHPLDPEDHLSLDEVVADIVAAAKGSPWEADFSKPEAVAHIRALVGEHLARNAWIERSWHADRNAQTDEAKAFRAIHHPGAGE